MHPAHEPFRIVTHEVGRISLHVRIPIMKGASFSSPESRLKATLEIFLS